MDAPKYAFLVRRIQKLSLLRRIWGRRTLEDIDMHMQQIPILEYVLKNDGCNQCEIAEALRVSAQSIALSTKRMQHAGLLVKDVDTNNLRRNKLSLTPKGIETTARCRERFDNLDSRMCNGLTRDELYMFCDVLDKMIANLSCGDLSEMSMDELRDIVCKTSEKENKENKEIKED